MQRFPSHVLRVFLRISVNAQVGLDKLKSGQRPRKRIKLRTITDLSKENFWMVRTQTEHLDASSGRLDQPGHQVHQRGLARTVRSYKAGDPRLDYQTHPVHSQNLAVEL